MPGDSTCPECGHAMVPCASCGEFTCASLLIGCEVNEEHHCRSCHRREAPPTITTGFTWLQDNIAAPLFYSPPESAPENPTPCSYCGDNIPNGSEYECVVCGEPIHRRCGHECPQCGSWVCTSCGEEWYPYCCEGCLDDANSADNSGYDEDVPARPSILRGEPTPLLPVNRAVGVEIEAESKLQYAQPVYRLEGCDIGSDGSLNNGVEVKTRPATQSSAVELIERACHALKEANYGIKSTCGLHVHVEASDLVDKNLKGLLALNLAFEDVIFALQPRSRANNQYCLPLRRVIDLDIVKEARDVDALWYGIQSDYSDALDRRKQQHHDVTRYYGMNLHSYWYRGTIEFRQHAGTLDPKKILRWASLCAGMVEASAQRGLDLFPIAERWVRQPTYRIDERTGVSKPNGRKLNALCRLAGLLPDQQQYFSNRLKYRLSVR